MRGGGAADGSRRVITARAHSRGSGSGDSGGRGGGVLGAQRHAEVPSCLGVRRVAPVVVRARMPRGCVQGCHEDACKDATRPSDPEEMRQGEQNSCSLCVDPFHSRTHASALAHKRASARAGARTQRIQGSHTRSCTGPVTWVISHPGWNPHDTVSHAARYPTRHGIPHGTVSRAARYPTRHCIPRSTVSRTE